MLSHYDDGHVHALATGPWSAHLLRLAPQCHAFICFPALVNLSSAPCICIVATTSYINSGTVLECSVYVGCYGEEDAM